MTILYPASKSVKSARRTFGVGILPQRPARLPIGPSEADLRWAAYELNKDCRDYEVVSTAEDRHYDRLADAAEALRLADAAEALRLADAAEALRFAEAGLPFA